jgi:hypothetical protein
MRPPRLACVEAWTIVGLFAACCGSLGAAVWNGAQPRSFSAMRDEIARPVNPEYAISYVLNEVLQAETVLRHVAEQDTVAGRTARRALYLIENGARR